MTREKNGKTFDKHIQQVYMRSKLSKYMPW